ncbi:MAG: fibro-slime domain-containing protein [Planctomycetota bacterium]|jgi:fibro-slime domain-containing protein
MNNARIATASCALGMLTYVGLMSLLSSPDAASGADDDPPEVLELTGIVRDFRERTEDGGHTDFEREPSHGFGHYVGNIAPSLSADRKAVFTGDGHKVNQQWKDAQGRQICWRVAQRYPRPDDDPGEMGAADTGGIHSTGSFEQWYRDVPGVNMSQLLTLKLARQADGTYVFDDELDATYQALGGFFPLEDQLYGNPGGWPDRNFHFTFELHGEFVYDADGGQIFKFVGDDDVWVFINDELVIDLGGVHSAVEQYIDLDRMGLEDGETYDLAFFFAERHRTQSNFRIVTNLPLESVVPPTISAIFD